MSGFSAQWLAMREGADAKARGDALDTQLNGWLDKTGPVNIVDLGCGSGANLRWLAPRIAACQRWSLFDNDPALLANAAHSLRDWAGARAAPAPRDDHSNCAAVLQLGERLTARLARINLAARLPSLDGVHLVTASALLDLVSRPWLSALVRAAARRRTAMLFALSYDGRVRFTPWHAHDAAMRDALNRDQHADKGFGPALGPDCVAALGSECAAHGYRVMQRRSDWQLGTDQRALHERLVQDFARIARRAPSGHEQHESRAWQDWRHDAVDTGRLMVGHMDILALPDAR